MCKEPLRSTFTLRLYEQDFADVGTAVEKGGGTGGGYEGEVREGGTRGRYGREVRGGGTGGRYEGEVREGGTRGRYGREVRGGGTGGRYEGEVREGVRGGGTGGRYEGEVREGEVREGEVQGEGEGRTGGIRTVRSHGCP